MSPDIFLMKSYVFDFSCFDVVSDSILVLYIILIYCAPAMRYYFFTTKPFIRTFRLWSVCRADCVGLIWQSYKSDCGECTWYVFLGWFLCDPISSFWFYFWICKKDGPAYAVRFCKIRRDAYDLRIRWPNSSDSVPKSDDSAHRILKSKNGIGI